MRDTSHSRRSMVDRRSVLVGGGAILAGLGMPSSVQRTNAKIDSGVANATKAKRSDLDEWKKSLPDGTEYESQEIVADETGAIHLGIPTAWGDISGAPTAHGATLSAAPNLEGFATTWDVPGMWVTVTTEFGTDPGAALDRLVDFSEYCDDGGREQTALPGYEYVAHGWYRCGGRDTMYLLLAGVPVIEPDAETVDEPYLVLIGAQIRTKQDMGAINSAIASLRTRQPDPENGGEEPENPDPLQMEAETSIASGQTVKGEIQGETRAGMYTLDGVSAGDRVTVEIVRTGGKGQQGFSLTEPGGGSGLAYAIDAAMIDRDGTNAITGESGPHILSGITEASDSDHTLTVIPSPYPAGVGPYQFTFVNEGQ